MSNKLAFTNFNIEDAHLFGGVSYELIINSDTDINIGTVAAAKLSFTTDLLTNTSIGSEFDYYVNTSTLKGHFIITNAEKDNYGKYNITAYDNINKFDKIVDTWYNGLTYPITIGALFSSLCTHCGLTAYSNTFTNSTASIPSKPVELSNINGKTMLGYIAQAAASNVVALPNGNIKLIQYTTTNTNLTNSTYKNYIYADYTTPAIDKVWIGKEEGDVGTTSGTGTNQLNITYNPLLFNLSTATVTRYKHSIHLEAMNRTTPVDMYCEITNNLNTQFTFPSLYQWMIDNGYSQTTWRFLPATGSFNSYGTIFPISKYIATIYPGYVMIDIYGYNGGTTGTCPVADDMVTTFVDTVTTTTVEVDPYQLVADNIYEVVHNWTYTPGNVELLDDNGISAGDIITITDRNNTARSFYVMSKSMNNAGCTLTCTGGATREVGGTNTNTEIQQLVGKSNILKRTLDETVSTVEDLSEGVSTAITQSSSAITLASTANDNANSAITVSGNAVTIASSKYGANDGASIVTAINNDTSSVSIRAGKVNVTGFVTFSNLSTSGQTTINGANISTGKINTSYIDAGSFTMTGGSININSSTYSSDTIKLNYGSYSTGQQPYGFKASYGSKTCQLINTGLLSSSGYGWDHYGSGWTTSGTVKADDGFTSSGVYTDTVSYATNMYIGNTGILHRTTNTSSRDIKHDITTEIKPELDPKKLYDAEVVQFKYNDGVIKETDPRYGEDLIGFIVEDLIDVYPTAVDCDPDNEYKPFAWNGQYLIPAMLKLIQEQHAEIESLKQRVEALENE